MSENQMGQSQEAGSASAVRFSATVIFVSLVAAVAAQASAVMSLPVWMMFIGWTAFGSGRGNVRAGVAAIGCLFVGYLLGMAGLLGVGYLGPAMGALALPVVVFLLVVVAMLAQLTPLDSIVGYFLGMTAYFASGLKPDATTFFSLATAGLIGGAAGWVLVVGPRLVKRSS
ncbi:hypothetical protein R70006_03167 [Paraburkholderia domus]|uniref:DUF1097 domain-containing protein n=1 Tax=Paraburkholderia domus TaxID=2793075 RepID=UPI001911A924|nr:DUF1097 domain-containing protein [Paraburkholderia domus]MBK5050486.1 DUF1097 domain-containing protein [Burkholderia sp. R-70006]CAE6754037.1 hypothetical protein R70006_03167 [Paraburkholderia domus]